MIIGVARALAKRVWPASYSETSNRIRCCVNYSSVFCFYCLFVLFSSELYLKQCSEDLVTYSSHAGRKTIEIEDVFLLLKRQRCINNTETFEYLVNTYLPLEYVEELLPCAVAGKKIVPSRLK